MKLLALNGDRCGAPLEVPEEAKFVALMAGRESSSFRMIKRGRTSASAEVLSFNLSNSRTDFARKVWSKIPLWACDLLTAQLGRYLA